MINKITKRRGTDLSPANRFENVESIPDGEYLEYCRLEDDWERDDRTQFIEVFPKTILNKVESPDIGSAYSMNPYQGCEHGCIYCYARNSHEYWGYNAGSDFEQKVMVKKNAPELLEKKLKSRSWKPVPIMLSGNTDCYQPIEARLKITRKLLEVLWKFRHPVSIITKNALILRDLDILKKMAVEHLVHVSVSITSGDDELRKKLEPRTASVSKRFRTVKNLSAAGIPVNVMLAPIIPAINSHELIPLVKRVREAGACNVNYLVVRLNGHNGVLFAGWLKKHFPDRSEKVMNTIRELHGGKVSDSRFGKRMRGEGKWSETLRDQFKTAKNLYFKDVSIPGYNYEAYRRPREDGQLNLFEG